MKLPPVQFAGPILNLRDNTINFVNDRKPEVTFSEGSDKVGLSNTSLEQDFVTLDMTFEYVYKLKEWSSDWRRNFFFNRSKFLKTLTSIMVNLPSEIVNNQALKSALLRSAVTGDYDMFTRSKKYRLSINHSKSIDYAIPNEPEGIEFLVE